MTKGQLVGEQWWKNLSIKLEDIEEICHEKLNTIEMPST
jgi:hypothetical protein